MLIKNRFFEAIREYNLIDPGDKVIVAVSGGADSVALLNLLHAYKDELKISLHVAHLNHLLRKGDAELDAKYVEALSQKLDLPVTIEAVDVAAYAEENGLSLEHAAREVRYAFLQRAAKATGASKIAVGHTADDNIETFLMHLLRGSGLKGLCGIPIRRGKIIRPLLKTWRKDIEDYVGSLKLVPRRDYTNYESKYLRNRVRLKLVPQLKIYNLNIKEIILQTILLLTEDKQYIEDKAEQALQKCLLEAKDNMLAIDLDKFGRLEGPIQSHVIRNAIEYIKGDLANLSYSHIKSVLNNLGKTEKWELHLPDGIYIVGSQNQISIARQRPTQQKKVEYNYILPIPGEVTIAESGKRVRASIVNNVDLGGISKTPANQAYVDYAFLSKNLVVRSRKEGDRFIPLGMKDRKKLQDVLVDEKVPGDLRDLVPIVESRGVIIWVAGVRLDERVKVTDHSKKIVKLEML